MATRKQVKAETDHPQVRKGASEARPRLTLVTAQRSCSLEPIKFESERGRASLAPSSLHIIQHCFIRAHTLSAHALQSCK